MDFCNMTHNPPHITCNFITPKYFSPVNIQSVADVQSPLCGHTAQQNNRTTSQKHIVVGPLYIDIYMVLNDYHMEYRCIWYSKELLKLLTYMSFFEMSAQSFDQ